MPDIYTSDWYEAVRDAMNASAGRLKGIPEGSFAMAIEITGDGVSPYVDAEGMRRFLVRIEGGRCLWYREIASREEEREVVAEGVDYRFTGPSTAFDEIAAGILDPIDAALRGMVKVRGDMRFLMRQAEHVKALLDAYASDVATTWPAGKPPYGAGRDTGAGAVGSTVKSGAEESGLLAKGSMRA